VGREDWYRRSTWTERDREEFGARLQRCRTEHTKAESLRIQALYLERVGGQEMLLASIALLDRLLQRHPVSSSLGAAYKQKGNCLLALGRVGEAIDAFRAALAAQRAHPFVRDYSHLDFAGLVLACRRSDLYPEVLAAFTEFGGNERLPIEQYRFHGARALMLDEMGNRDEAREAALAALEASRQVHSSFHKHPTEGLVTDPDPSVQERLSAIANNDVRA
jgi:tetratricopeptide (TPR) repeat protein